MIMIATGLVVPYRTVHGQVVSADTQSEADVQSEADTQSEEERLQNRIVPVPKLISGFQTGVLLGLTVDGDKFSENWNPIYDHINAFIDYQQDPFIFSMSFGFSNQGKFDVEGHDTQVVFGHNFLIYEGIIGLVFDQFLITAGWGPLNDIIDSPYSLLFSSRKNPAINVDFVYDSDAFFFVTRWVVLNYQSALDFQDRGMNARSLGFKVYDRWDGVWRVGYQDAAVYVDRYFDPIYAFVPLPYAMTQLFVSVSGNPIETKPDPNVFFGIFIDYVRGPHYSYLQLLLDDATIAGIAQTFTAKIAWSLGYRIDTDVGKFGFYHAGATKSTYQATRTENPYPYIRYPTNTYNTTSGTKAIPYSDNYIGYLYGDNVISFRAEYEDTFGILDVTGGIEYVISGDKSLLNPWHGATSIDGMGGTQLLDRNRLEHTVMIDAGVTVRVFEDINLLFEGSVGYVFNELALTNPPASDTSDEQFFTPSINSTFLYSAFVGVQYNYNQHEPEWRKRYNSPQLRK